MKIAFLAFAIPLSILWSQTFKIVPSRTSVLQRDSVQLWFRILDDHGKPDATISRDQVEVADNGAPVGQFSFSYGIPPAGEKTYTVLVLDASGSMRFNDKLEKLKRSAKNIVRSMSPENYCAIIAFSSKPRLVAGFTNDREYLTECVDKLTASGYTAVYDALWEAILQVETQPASSNKMVLLITDGREEGKSLLGMKDIAGRIQTLDNLSIHAFDMNRSGPVDDLRRIAKLGGGTYTYDPVPDHVFAIIDRFLSDLSKAYIISYVPGERTDGLHDVLLGVNARGIRQQVETRYTGVFSRPWIPEGAAAFTGMMAAVVIGTMLFTYMRRRKSFALIAHPLEHHRQEPAPFSIVEEDAEERTRALSFPEERDDEKTILIEDRRHRDNVLGNLSVTHSDGSGQIIEIDSAEILFGRSPQCKARFDDKEVSRLHAKLRLEREGFILYDLGSANGTFVNGQEVQKCSLRSGDEIDIGKNRIVFRAGDGQA